MLLYGLVFIAVCLVFFLLAGGALLVFWKPKPKHANQPPVMQATVPYETVREYVPYNVNIRQQMRDEKLAALNAAYCEAEEAKFRKDALAEAITLLSDPTKLAK